MTEGLVQINVLDIPRIYTAIAEWASCLLFSLYLTPRFSKPKTAVIAAAALALQSFFLVISADVGLLLWLPCMLAAIGMMLFLLLMINHIDFRTAVYTCVRAFLLAEFMASLEWQIHCFLWSESNVQWWKQWGLLVFVFGGILLIVAAVEKKYVTENQSLMISSQECTNVLLVGIVIFAMSNLSFYYGNTPFSGQYAGEVMNIRTLVDALGVVLTFTYHIQHSQNEIRRELSTMQIMLENQYAQYRMNRDSIDMVNRKYHDMKHLIEVLRRESDADLQKEWLDKMERDIKDYELQNKTGNPVLDIMLSAKMLQCQNHGISMTIIADGKALSFMDKMDICTIFGNALDNAIEHVRKISDKEKRIIHLKVVTQKQFLLCQVENYCPEPPKFQGDLPVTTKKDRDNHGYGLKSIQYTVKKYGGRMTVKAEKEWFLLKVLIPLPESNDL